jgi:D-alanyl-lipoteichoic acid acyltransferase DltB (MBOAT superfamily)
MPRSGLQLFLWGMIKKIIVADNLAVMVNNIFATIDSQSSFALIIAIYCYAIQIYFDFSGYTDMARGSSRLLGIEIIDNFNFPYFAPSIQDFWKRWHISLSSWILDYIFRPLQMKWREMGDPGIILSLMITFFICGLWHGLALNYMIWGLYHGALMSFSFLTYKKWIKFCKVYKFNQTVVYLFDVFVTFHLVCFSWLLFRISSLSDISLILSKIFKDIVNCSVSISLSGNDFGITRNIYYIALLVLTLEFLQVKFDIKRYFDQTNIVIRWSIYMAAVLMILSFGTATGTQFIYFQF